MDELELANSLSGEEIARQKLHFINPEAERIALLKVLNSGMRHINDFLDSQETPPRKRNIWSKLKGILK